MSGVVDDERLAMLLDQLVEESEGGHVPNFDVVLADIPTAERQPLEKELRSLWATAMIANDLAIDPATDPAFGPIFGDEFASSPRLSDAAAKNDTAGSTASHASTEVDAGPQIGAPELKLPIRMGDYELIEEIGRGGMGVVYKAREDPLGRQVAVKMILAGELATAEQLARFRREAEAAAKLKHPLIVPVHKVGELTDERGRQLPFFSMMHVEGTTLAHRLRSGPIPSREAAALLIRVCRAVAAAHKQGVLHRDLKPSNILLDRTGRPYITDFGLAAPVRSGGQSLTTDALTQDAGLDESQPLTSSTNTGAILGTLSYMAPEQALGARGVVGPAADVYALGGLLYVMLTGRPPFQAETPLDTVLMVLEQDPPRPRLLNPRADEDLEVIALKALQKPPDLRYASAELLAEDLDAYLLGNPITARNYSLGQFLSRALRPTHQVDLLQNWGLLWMWHALALLVLCLITTAFQWSGTASRVPYLLLWTVGLGAWALAFWQLRRRAGPVTFVERQIAHVWAGSMACVGMLYALEALLGLPVLKLSPVLGLVAGTVFLIKAGMLSGEFYIQAAVLYATSLAMALWPQWSLVVFGFVSALCFAVPGYKFYRQRQAATGNDDIEAHLKELRALRA